MPTGIPVNQQVNTQNRRVNQQSSSFSAVTPDDSNDLSSYAYGLYVGGAGNIAIIGVDDSSAVTFVGIPAGSFLPVMAKRVMSTGTTATNIVALH